MGKARWLRFGWQACNTSADLRSSTRIHLSRLSQGEAGADGQR